MTNKNLKWLLYSSVNADAELNRLISMRADEYEKITCIVAKLGASGSGTPDPHKFDRLVEIDDLISKAIDRREELRAEELAAFDRLTDERERRVMYERYLNYDMHSARPKLQPWERIADKLAYTRQHITRLHGQALVHLKDVL